MSALDTIQINLVSGDHSLSTVNTAIQNATLFLGSRSPSETAGRASIQVSDTFLGAPMALLFGLRMAFLG
jgi:hypothetical protein